MKNIFIIYSGSDWNKKTVLSNSVRTRQTIEDWHRRGSKYGLKIYRASIDWYDDKKNFFKKSWTLENGNWIKVCRNVKPDFILDKTTGKQDYEIFNRKLRISRNTEILNSPLFRTMLGNKLSQYLCLGEFMPKSFLAIEKSEVELILKNIKTKKVVAKPLYGSGGFGITICDRKNIKLDSMEFPVMMQEFIGGNCGIPGFSAKNRLADLRIVFIDHKPMYALSRIAKKGSLFTNFHQGAEVVLVPEKVIPDSVKIMVKKIICRLAIYSRANYSLDFMFDQKGKPYLIEINTSPGLDLLDIVGTEKIKEKYFSGIVSNIKP